MSVAETVWSDVGGTADDPSLATRADILLSNLASQATARQNLGLGDSAVQDAADLPLSTAATEALAGKADLANLAAQTATALEATTVADGSASVDAFVVMSGVTKRATLTGLMVGLLTSATPAAALTTLGLGPASLRTGVTPISTNTTINAHVVMTAGASFNISPGVTLTITGSVQAPIAPIFSGGGTVLLKGAQDALYPQWWGAVGDGLTTGVDGPAIQAALNCAASPGGCDRVYLPRPPAYYNITGTTLTITASDVALDGAGSETCQVLSTSGTGTLLSVGGASPSALASRNRVQGVTFGRTVAPGAGSTTVSFQNTVWLNANDLIAHNSAVCVAISTCKSSTFQKIDTFRTFPYAGTGDTYKGFDITGSCYTSHWINCRSIADASDTAYPFAGSSYGFHVHPSDLRDLWFKSCQADLTTYGYYTDGAGTSNSGTNQNWDVRFVDCTTDSFGVAGHYVTNITGYGMVSITGSGWINSGITGATSYGVRIDNAWNVSVQQQQLFSVGNFAFNTSVYVTRSVNCTISGNTIMGSKLGIVCDGTSVAGGYSNSHAITANSIFNPTADGNTMTTAVSLNATYGCTVSANTISAQSGGGMTNGVAITTGGSNAVTGNTMLNVTNPVVLTSSGGGNRIYANPGVTDQTG